MAKDRCSVINGVQIVDVTPELTEEEIVNRANFIVRGLLHLQVEETNNTIKKEPLR
ncbi:MAG: hypothetical protein ACRC3H_07285 [Lachnospiraceae bacterium]